MLKIEKLAIINNDQKDGVTNLSFAFPNQGLFVVSGNPKDQKILFQLLSYQKKATLGEVFIGGKNTNFFTKEDIAFCYNFVFGIFSSQEPFLIEGLTVQDNIKVYLEIQNKTFNTKQAKTVLENFDLLAEIELDSFIEELTNEQKQKLLLAILMLKESRIIIAFAPQLDLLPFFKQLSKTKLVIVFANEVNGTPQHHLADQKLTIQKNGFWVDGVLRQTKTTNQLNFDTAQQKYLQTHQKRSCSFVNDLIYTLFEPRSLPLKFVFLFNGFFRLPPCSIALSYTSVFSIFTFIIMYCLKNKQYLLLLLSLLILLILTPLIFFLFCWYQRIESKNTSVLNEKKIIILQKMGVKADDLVTVFKADTYNNLNLEIFMEVIFNLFWIPICLWFIYLLARWLKIIYHPIFILAPLGLICLATPFILVPLMIRNVVKKRVDKDLFQIYYNYLVKENV